MKKTLIALAVAASAAVSGSAMAWTANGTGGSVGLGGTLTPTDVVTPWEVKVGAAVNGLNADIRKGDTKVDIPVKNTIPVLGIRTVKAEAFAGSPGLSPQISYGNAVNVDAFEASVAPLTLEVKNVNDAKIGSLTTDMFAQARTSIMGGWEGKFWNYASQAGQGFFGGLPKSADKVASVDRVDELMPEAGQNYVNQSAPEAGVNFTTFTGLTSTHSAYYFSVIESGKSIKITLEQPAASDAIAWKASLPVTVSYQ
ncbi:F4 family fimbrial subunit [Escherichia coli]|uniref:F4 family fimbrial subunit n=1 Tax=Escherichia coli TaxID=562 RepID=UPI003D1D5A58